MNKNMKNYINLSLLIFASILVPWLLSDSHSTETLYETNYDYQYELEIPGLNGYITEFTPKASPNHLCIYTKNHGSTTISYFSKL